MVNKPATKGGEGEEENRDCRKGGPTKLPAKGGGQQQRPGKEEPLVGKEAGRNQRPPSKLDPVLVPSGRRLVPIQAILLCNDFSSILIIAQQCGSAGGEQGGAQTSQKNLGTEGGPRWRL